MVAAQKPLFPQSGRTGLSRGGQALGTTSQALAVSGVTSTSEQKLELGSEHQSTHVYASCWACNQASVQGFLLHNQALL